jgi:ferric-chelate reductase
MHFSILQLLLFICATYANVLTPFIAPNEFNSSVYFGPLTVYWNLNQPNNTIEMAIVGDASGYVSIAFSPNGDGMTNGDTIIGYYDQNTKQTRIYTVFMHGLVEPTLKSAENPPGSSYLIATNGGYRNGQTTLKFIRPIDVSYTKSPWDKNIEAVPMVISWALHKSNTDIFQKHTSAGLGTVDFTVPGARSILPEFPFHLIICGAFIVLTIILGLFTTGILLPSRYKRNMCFEFLFYRKILRVSRNKFLEAIWYNKIADFTFGELYMIVLFFAMGFTFFAWGYLNAVSESLISPTARAFAWISIFNVSFILLPITKYSVWYFIFGISFERAVKFHRWISLWNVVTVSAHGIIIAISYSQTSTGAAYAFEWSVNALYWNMPGTIAWGLFLIVALVSIKPIRRKLWEFFLYTHIICGFIAIVMVILHATALQSLPYFAVSLILYALDLVLRFVIGVCLPAKLLAVEYLKESDVIKLTISKRWPFLYKPGQWVYIWIDAIDYFAWQPFSLASISTNSHGKKIPDHLITLFVKNMEPKSTARSGRKLLRARWTTRLAIWAEKVQCDPSILDKAHIRIQGPFGSISHDYLQYRTVVLVAGGIGITSMYSIFLTLLDRWRTDPELYADKKVYLIWVKKSPDMWKM